MQNSLGNLLGLGILIFAAALRVAELFASDRNQKNMSGSGFRRRDDDRSYLIMVVMHASFFICCVVEFTFFSLLTDLSLKAGALLIFAAAQILRFWAISSLGRYWNTNVMTADAQDGFVSNGPYRFIRHPNYLAVILEFASIPLILGAWRTAVIYSVWNALVLRYRIDLEEKQLEQIPGYFEAMHNKARFIPGVF